MLGAGRTRGLPRRRLAPPFLLACLAASLTFASPAPAEGAPTDARPSLNAYSSSLYATGSHPYHVAMADVTGDGRLDALMTTSFYFDEEQDFKLFVFPGTKGDRLGRPRILGTHGGDLSSMRLATGDVDHDGYTDVALTAEKGVDVFYGSESGLEPATFFPLVGDTYANKPFVVDLDGDEAAELLVATDKGLMASLGASTRLSAPVWTTLTEHTMGTATFGDVTGDGRLDYVGSKTTEVFVVPQTGDGVLGSPVAYETRVSFGFVNGLTVGDITGDGTAEVVFTWGGAIPDTHVEVLRQTADGSLERGRIYRVFNGPGAVDLHDMNGDGRLDVVLVHDGWASAGIMHQSREGTLEPEVRYYLWSRNHFPSLALGDVVGDSRPDILAPSFQPDAGPYHPAETGLNVLEAVDRRRSHTTARIRYHTHDWTFLYGRVRGARPGGPFGTWHSDDVRVTVYGKGSKGFKSFRSTWVTLDGNYAWFVPLRTRRIPSWAAECRVVAEYPGNQYFLPSRASAAFRC